MAKESNFENVLIFVVIFCSSFTTVSHHNLLMQPAFCLLTWIQFLVSCLHDEEHGFVCCCIEYSLLTLEKDSRKGFLLAKSLSVETERERLTFQRATSLSSTPWPFTMMPRFNSLSHIPNRATEVLSRCVSHKK